MIEEYNTVWYSQILAASLTIGGLYLLYMVIQRRRRGSEADIDIGFMIAAFVFIAVGLNIDLVFDFTPSPAAPAEAELCALAAFLSQSSNQALAALALFGVSCLYYALVWHIFDRDPIPFEAASVNRPPDGISPAAARYILEKGRITSLDNRQKIVTAIFSASLMDMAQKGYLKFSDNFQKLGLADQTQGKDLPPEQRAIVGELFVPDRTFSFAYPNQEDLRRAKSAFLRAVEARYGVGYVDSNTGWIIAGALL